MFSLNTSFNSFGEIRTYSEKKKKRKKTGFYNIDIERKYVFFLDVKNVVLTSLFGFFCNIIQKNSKKFLANPI